MEKKAFIFILLVSVFVNLYAQSDIFRQEGIASWYGREYDGRPTASGEIFDSSQLTAAHPNLPFGTVVVVTNQHNNKKVTVRINDRGPFVAARIIDISRAAAEHLDMIVTGTAPVSVETVERLSLAPSSTPPATVTITDPVAPVIIQAPAPVSAPTQVSVPVVPTAQLPVPVTPVTAPVTVAPVTPVTMSVDAVTAPTSVINANSTPTSVFQQPVSTSGSNEFALRPQINIAHNKTYRLQVGSYRVARNAVDAFEKLKNAGLNPAYERFADSNNGEYFRVVLAGVTGADVQPTAEKLREAGFREALIREEN